MYRSLILSVVHPENDGSVKGHFRSSQIIMFSKENKANLGSLLGYVAEVEFTNNSKEKAELFSIGAEVSESSK